MTASLPWLKVYWSLPRHPKSLDLARELGQRRAWTYVVELWMWACENAPSGDLSSMHPRSIATAAGWKGKAERFVDALKASGFLDSEQRLHDWEEHQPAHVAHAERVESAPAVDLPPEELKKQQRRAADAQRKRDERARTSAAASKPAPDASAPECGQTADASAPVHAVSAERPHPSEPVRTASTEHTHARDRDLDPEDSGDTSPASTRAPASQSPLPYRPLREVPDEDVKAVVDAWVKNFKPDPKPGVQDLNRIRQTFCNPELGELTAASWVERIEAYSRDPFWNGSGGGGNKLDFWKRFGSVDGFRQGARLVEEQKNPVRPTSTGGSGGAGGAPARKSLPPRSDNVNDYWKNRTPRIRRGGTPDEAR